MTKVSVIVPVYNPGEHFRRCLDSLVGQTLAAADYEVIFVDDGSTDGTSDVLDQAAAAHRPFRVVHQPNSGWPGQPRNLGMDLARGEFLFFCDADDWLASDALEVLHRFAVENGSDIVLGKMAGIGRPVPRVLFDKTRPVATLAAAPLMDSLTVHKLFRHAFLLAHGIRFAEGRRRLEDHLFMAQAYLSAEVISVYAERTCYFHSRQTSGISAQSPHWPSYFTDLEEVVEVVERLTQPGPFRDRLLSRWLRVEMVSRLSGQSLAKRSPHETAALFDAAHRVAARHFGPGVIAALNPTDRMVARAIVRGNIAEVWERAAIVADWQLEAQLLQIGWIGTTLQLCGTVAITERERASESAELRFGRLFPDVDPSELNKALTSSTPAIALENPRTGERHRLSSHSRGSGLSRTFTVDLGPTAFPANRSPGSWFFWAEYRVLGLGGRAPLRLVEERPAIEPPQEHASARRPAILTVRKDRRVELVVNQPSIAGARFRPGLTAAAIRRRAARAIRGVRRRLGRTRSADMSGRHRTIREIVGRSAV